MLNCFIFLAISNQLYNFSIKSILLHTELGKDSEKTPLSQYANHASENTGTSLFIFKAPPHLFFYSSLECRKWQKFNSSLSLLTVKGQWHEIFCFRFFSWIIFPQVPDNNSRAIWNFLKLIHEKNWSWKFRGTVPLKLSGTVCNCLWTGVLPYAPYRSLLISKLFCKDGGGGCGGIHYDFRRYFWGGGGGGGFLWIQKGPLGARNRCVMNL